MTLDERAMVRGMQRGDNAAFAAFVDRYGARLHALARRFAHCDADADDLSQEIVIAVCRGIGNFRGSSALSTWVYRIAMNHCLKHQQRRPAPIAALDETVIAPDSVSPERQLDAAVARDAVEAALTTLSDDHRTVVILHELHGLTYAECADAIGVPIGTVKSRLFHAFRRLRPALAALVDDGASPIGRVAATEGAR